MKSVRLSLRIHTKCAICLFFAAQNASRGVLVQDRLGIDEYHLSSIDCLIMNQICAIFDEEGTIHGLTHSDGNKLVVLPMCDVCVCVRVCVCVCVCVCACVRACAKMVSTVCAATFGPLGKNIFL